MRKRHPQPPPGVRQAWAQLQAYGCLLCRQPAAVAAVWVPAARALPGVVPGSTVSYLLCARCYARPAEEWARLVEQHILADRRRTHPNLP